jgi:type IV fimbrial biogenesis protein FimT
MIPAPAQRGFTMIELMVTVSIAAIMMTVAIPSFVELIRNSRLTTQANDFVLSLMYAKSEAIKRNQSVVVCSSADGASCANSVNWEQGWIVYQDANQDGAVDSNEILQVKNSLTGGNTLRTGTRTRITFRNSGFSLGSNATFNLCDTRGTGNGRTLVLSNQGRVNTTPPATSCP